MALAEQDKALDELRSRTGTLLAASSLVASFLGGRAFDLRGFDWANIVALAAFGAAALLAINILFPRNNLKRSLSGPAVYEHFVSIDADLAEAHRQLAYWIQEAHAENTRFLNRLVASFRAACVA